MEAVTSGERERVRACVYGSVLVSSYRTREGTE